MLEIKDYSMSDEIKLQLGHVIRETRKNLLQEAKGQYLIEKNPYTKENLCENNTICHYHTLTKIENGEEAIKAESLYHTLLDKLDLLYQVTEDEHIKNMTLLDNLSKQLLHSIEYIDDKATEDIRKQVSKIDFTRDCIAGTYARIIQAIYELQMFKKVDEENIAIVESFIDFYEGIYKGLAYHSLGIYYYNLNTFTTSLEYFKKAKNIYQENNIGKNVINSFLIGLYKAMNNYLDMVTLCNEMEEYYQTTKNHKRLMYVYNYLSSYYLLVNADDIAKDYFEKAITKIGENDELDRYKFILYYNWGVHLFIDFKYEKSLSYFKKAYVSNTNNMNRLKIINMLLIILTKLNQTDTINDIIKDGEKYFTYGHEKDKLIFKYFNYKYTFKKYHRRYALEKIIPILKNEKRWKEVLLFFYEDLYK